MPEGDTLARIAAGLRPVLVGQPVMAARARLPGPNVERIVGRTVTEVLSMGKNLLIRLDNGLELRTHLRMNGTWHRYRPGERWRRAPARAAGSRGAMSCTPPGSALRSPARTAMPRLRPRPAMRGTRPAARPRSPHRPDSRR